MTCLRAGPPSRLVNARSIRWASDSTPSSRLFLGPPCGSLMDHRHSRTSAAQIRPPSQSEAACRLRCTTVPSCWRVRLGNDGTDSQRGNRRIPTVGARLGDEQGRGPTRLDIPVGPWPGRVRGSGSPGSRDRVHCPGRQPGRSGQTSQYPWLPAVAMPTTALSKVVEQPAVP